MKISTFGKSLGMKGKSRASRRRIKKKVNRNKSYMKEKEEWVPTTRVHESFEHRFEIGTLVKVIGCDDIRGLDIQDKNGNRICEIGWEI